MRDMLKARWNTKLQKKYYIGGKRPMPVMKVTGVTFKKQPDLKEVNLGVQFKKIKAR